MIDEKRIKRFIEGAKEAFKEVDDPTFTFPMNILSAYEFATSIEELLKEQEPRVLTLEEVVKHYSLPLVVLDDPGWKTDYLLDIEPLYFDFPVDVPWAVHWRGYQQAMEYIDDWKASYGQKWRCWTFRPTDEQRKAVKWND